MAQHEVTIVTRFSNPSQSISNIVNAAEAQIKKITAAAGRASPPVTGRALAEQIQPTQLAAERRIQTLGATGGLSGPEMTEARTRLREMIQALAKFNEALGQSGRRAVAAYESKAIREAENLPPLQVQQSRRAAGREIDWTSAGEVMSRTEIGQWGAKHFGAPDAEEVRNLHAFVNDAQKLSEVLGRIASRTVDTRRFGLQVGRAEEQGLAQDDARRSAAGEETQSQIRASLNRLTRQREARENQAALADREYISATVEAATTRKRLANTEALAIARARLDTSEGRHDTTIEGQRRAAEAAIRNRVQVAQEQSFAADPGAINTAGAARRLAELNQVRIREAELGIQADESANVATRQGTIAHAQANRARERQAQVVALTTAEERAAQGQLLIEQRKLQAAINQEARQYLQSQPGGAGGTRFQQIQSFIASRQGGEVRLPQEFLQLRQFLTARFLTTAGFALSGGALYGAVSGIRELVTNASELQRILSQVQAQFEQVGDVQGFDRFRKGIFDIARETGVASKDVAFVAFQLRGAFSGAGDAAEDTTRAIRETGAAIQFARVSGLQLTEVVDSLTAIALSFDTTIAHVSDVSIGLQETSGVLAKEIVKGLGDIAPVAAEAGLSIDQMGAIITTAQQNTGRSGASIAEGFGRIIPSLQASGVEVARLYANIPQLSGHLGEVERQLGAGRTGDVLLGLIRDYDKLTKAQQNNVIAVLGGRREAQVLIPVLQNHDKYVRNLQGAYDSAGKTQDYFSRLQDTVAQQVAQATEEFRQLGEALFRAGLADILRDAAIGAGGLLRVLRFLLNVFAEINRATGGWAVRLGEVIIAMRLLQALGRQATIERLLGGIGIGAQGAGAIGGVAGEGALAGLSPAALAALQGQTIAARTRAQLASLRASSAFPALATGGGLLAAGQIGQAVFHGGAPEAASQGLSGVGGGVLIGGLLGAPVLGATVGGALAVNNAYQQQHQRNQSDAAKLRKQLQDKSIADLQEILKNYHKDFGDFAASVFGTTPKDVIEEVLRSKESAGPIAQLKGLKGKSFESFRRFSDADKDRLKDAATEAFKDHDDKLGLEINDLRKHGLTPDRIDEIVAKAAAGDKRNVALLNTLIDVYSRKPGGRSKLDAAALSSAGDQKKVSDALRVDSGESLRTAQDALTAFQSGDIDQGEFLRVVDQELAIYKGIGHLNDDQAKKYLATQKIKADFFSDQARSAVDLQVSLATAAGVRNPQANTFLRLTALLQSGILTPKAALKAAEDIVGMSQALLQERIKTAKTIDEKLALIRNGIEFPPEARVAIVRQQIEQLNPAWAVFLRDFVAGIDGLSGTLKETVIKAVAAGAEAAGQAILLLAQRLAEINAILNTPLAPAAEVYFRNQRTATQKALDEANRQRGALNAGVGAPGTIKPTPEEQLSSEQQLAESRFAVDKAYAQGDPVRTAQLELQLARESTRLAKQYGTETDINNAVAREVTAGQNLRQANVQVQQARFDVLRAQAEGDPIALAQIDARAADYAASTATGPVEALQAQAARIRASTALRQAYQARAEAEVDLLKAQAEGDPVAVAQLEQRAADLAIQNARGEVERLGALARKFRADRAFQQALEQVFQARTDLAVALLGYAGLDVQAADLQAQAALDALNRATALGRPKFEIAQLQAAYIRAAQQSRDTKLSSSEREIDVALQLERITTQQAIAQLEALLKIPGITKQQTDEILLKIQELRRSVSQDLQFDVPSQIELPTLYEVRRALQGSRQGQGYQDNRNININIVANNSLDANAAMAQVTDALSGGSRYGIRPRLY